MLGRAPLVAAGDFNCVLSKTDRKRVGEDFKVDKTSVLLQGLVRDFNLVDCFKICIKERRASPGLVVMVPKPLESTTCLQGTARRPMLH